MALFCLFLAIVKKKSRHGRFFLKPPEFCEAIFGRVQRVLGEDAQLVAQLGNVTAQRARRAPQAPSAGAAASSFTEPPAFSMAATAALEAASTSRVSFAFNSPLPRILT